MRANRHIHIAFHKPRGYSCSHSPEEAPIIDELLPSELCGIGLQPVGRLDRDTSGLLILTTDGQLNHALAQPRQKVEKRYRIGFRGKLPEDAVARCAAGMQIEGEPTPTRPAQLTIAHTGRFRTAVADERLGEATLILQEGRRHQVRRMFRAMGASVVTLHRDRLGPYSLPRDLAPGQLVEISVAELGLRPALGRCAGASRGAEGGAG